MAFASPLLVNFSALFLVPADLHDMVAVSFWGATEFIESYALDHF